MKAVIAANTAPNTAQSPRNPTMIKDHDALTDFLGQKMQTNSPRV